jgi:hypothetical protein
LVFVVSEERTDHFVFVAGVKKPYLRATAKTGAGNYLRSAKA